MRLAAKVTSRSSGWSASGPRDRVGKLGGTRTPRLCGPVLRVDAVLAEKVTEPLDLIAQGWKVCPLPLADLASGLALAVRPAGSAEVSGAQGRVPLTLEGPTRAMRGVPAR